MTDHIFRPRIEPARYIYDALVAEQEKRKDRTVEEWLFAEKTAVLDATNTYAGEHKLSLVTREDVDRADVYASGSVDYGAKFAYRIVERMNERTRER